MLGDTGFNIEHIPAKVVDFLLEIVSVLILGGSRRGWRVIK